MIPSRRGPIVLMYHAFGDSSEPASRYVMPARRFGQQMAWLRSQQYPLVPLSALPLAGPRAVVVTIDDAYTDLFTLGLPILRRHRIPATVFVVSQRVGQHNDWEPVGPLSGRSMATWSEIRQMSEAGAEIGAHSRSHRSLAQLADVELRDEIAGSRDDVAAALARPVETFAYPFGRSSPATRRIAHEAGLRLACGVRPDWCGTGVDPYDLPRVEMQGTWRLAHLALALWFGHVPARVAH